MELFKVIPDAESGVYLDSNNNRVDLITAEVRFYCPQPSQCNGQGNCGDPGTCCKRFASIEEAESYYNLVKYDMQ
jgi:hypothetical protein